MTVTDSAPVDDTRQAGPSEKVDFNGTAAHSQSDGVDPTTSPRSSAVSESPDAAGNIGTVSGAVGFGFGVAALLIGLTVLLVPLGTSNDDVMLNSVFTGQFIGEVDSQGLFTHALVGAVVSSLSSAWPGAPWFAIVLLTTHLVATGSFLSIVAMHAGRRSLATVAALCTVLGLDLWAVGELSWTSAAFASAAAGLAVATSISTDRLSTPAVAAWASLLIGWGAALRFESFIGAALVAAPVAFAAVLDRQRRRRAVIALGCAVFVAAASFVGQQLSLNDEWREYADYTTVRGSLADSTRLDSVNFEDPDLVGLDFTETEVLLFDSWFFDDPEVFGPAQLAALTDATSRGVPSMESTSTSVISVPGGSEAGTNEDPNQSSLAGNLTEHGLKIILIGGIALLVISHRTLTLRSFAALASLGGAVALIPVIMFVARLTGRVLVGLLISAAYLAVSSMAGSLSQRSRLTTPSTLVLTASAVASALVLIMVIGPANQRQHDAEVQRLVELAAIDPDGVFLLWEEPLGDLGLLGLSDLPDLELVINGWLIASPPQVAQLERLGIDDQFTALVERRDSYAVQVEPERLAALADYLERRRNLTVEVRPAANGLVAEVVRSESER